MMKKIKVLFCALVLILASGTLDVYAQSKYNKERIKGTRREISMELNRSVFKSSKEAIFVNEDSVIDAISATPLAYAKNAPIIITQWKYIDKITKDYIKDLGVEKITIIGGLKAISRTTEKELTDMGIKVERIYGENRYDTSIQIAKQLDKIQKVSDVFLISSSAGVENSLALYSYAAQNNIPIIWNTKEDFKDIKKFVKKYDVENVYAVGNSENFIAGAKENFKNVQIIREMNKSETSIPIINKMHKGDIDTVYTATPEYGRKTVAPEYISLGVVAAKQNIPILVCGESFTYNQSKFLERNKVNKIIEVGAVVDDYSIAHTLTSRSFISATILIGLLLIITFRAFRYGA
ncbi:cell wall-binding repeat-containing protein [Romboutsia sp.]|uniref:cell wall-binding repeat-containing protein n=1 Tax=Romboutsia sp. TaxID=1965302 RepID=UPI003F2C31B8